MTFELGSYTGSSAHSTFQVRLDALRSNNGKVNFVSGDCFDGTAAIADRFAWSFFSKETKFSDEGDVLFVEFTLFGKLPQLSKLEGRLECQDVGGELQCVLRIFDPPGIERVVENFKLKRISSLFRQVHWVIDRVQGASDTDVDKAILRSVLQESVERLNVAGVEVKSDQDMRTINSPNGFVWSEGDLRELLKKPSVQSRVVVNQQQDWRFYLLIATQFRDSSTTGIMFDDEDQFHRQGAAVFWNSIKSASGSNFSRDFRRTIVHEIGHIFNLRHSFEAGKAFGGKAASTSFMNYPQKYSNGPDAYWADHLANGGRFEFEEEYFIRHGHFEELIMGSAPYGFGNRDSNAFNSVCKADKLKFEIRIKPDSHGNIFEFGESVIVEAKLENVSAKSVTVLDALDPAHRVTAYLLEQPGGKLCVIRPPAIRCSERQPIELAPAKAHFEDVQISYGIDSFYTMEPGRYRLQAAYYQDDFPLYSNVLTFWVSSPDRPNEKRVIDTFDSKWCEYFSLWGSSKNLETDFLNPSLKTIQHPLQLHYWRCRQTRDLRGYVSDVRAGADETLEVVTKSPNFHRDAWRKLLALDPKLKLSETATGMLSNLTYSTLATRFAAKLLEQGDKQGKHAVVNAISARHRKFNRKKPLSKEVRSQIQEKIFLSARYDEKDSNA